MPYYFIKHLFKGNRKFVNYKTFHFTDLRRIYIYVGQISPNL